MRVEKTSIHGWSRLPSTDRVRLVEHLKGQYSASREDEHTRLVQGRLPSTDRVRLVEPLKGQYSASREDEHTRLVQASQHRQSQVTTFKGTVECELALPFTQEGR